MIPSALREINADLDPENIELNREALSVEIRRLEAQAEMAEGGLGDA